MLIPMIILTFLLNTIFLPITGCFAQGPLTVLDLPRPGVMISTSPQYAPAVVKGLNINPKDPFDFDFIVDTGEAHLPDAKFKEESLKLIKYFLASLTTPEEDMWVNLSPYEKNRIIPVGFGKTEMGRDLLAEDYILKQLTASLIYPDKELGQEFWKKVYTRAQQLYGTTNVPINTFNKIWIVPQKALIYEHSKGAFIVSSRLKVMLEEDYLSLKKHQIGNAHASQISALSSQAVKEVLIPVIEEEVNNGKNFATLRQVYNSMILATWYKRNLKQSILAQVYMDKNRTKGINVQDKDINNKIYRQYLEAYKKGAFNFIKEEQDGLTQTVIPRKYFSGGIHLTGDFAMTNSIGNAAMRTGEFRKVNWRVEGVGGNLNAANQAMSTPLEDYLFRPFGKTGLKFFIAGHGAIWTGRKWPTNNENYVKPGRDEVFASYDIAFKEMDNRDGVVMIDTAPAYGEKNGTDLSSEEWIGEYFKEHPKLIKRAFITTKVGEEAPQPPELKGEINHSVEHLRISVDRSLQRLGRIDLLYIHQATAQGLADGAYKAELLRMKTMQYGGIKFLGASISNKEELEKAVNQNLIDWLDAIQIPAWLFNEHKDLVEKIYEKGIAIVVNSAGRGVKDNDYRAGYLNIASDPRVSVILVGSRGHLEQTVDYFKFQAGKLNKKWISDQKWNEEIQKFLQDKDVSILGATGFVGRRLVVDLLKMAGGVLRSVKFLTRDLEGGNAQQLLGMVDGLPGREKLIPVQGDQLNPRQIRNIIGGSKVIISTAGLAWQHPGSGTDKDKYWHDIPHLLEKDENAELLLRQELVQNAISAALLGLEMSPAQRLVWTSTNATDNMFLRLNEDDQDHLREEVNARAKRYLAYLRQALADGSLNEVKDPEILFAKFVSKDLHNYPPLEFPKTKGSNEMVSYARVFSYNYSKYLGQRLLEMIHEEDNKDIRVLMISDVYGPGQSIDQQILTAKGGLRRPQVFLAAYKAISEGQQEWISEIGQPPMHSFNINSVTNEITQSVWKDYVAPTFVGDVTQMIIRAAVSERKLVGIVYKVSASPLSNKEFAERLGQLFNTDVHVVESGDELFSKPQRQDDDLSLLGMKELTPLEEGVHQWISQVANPAMRTDEKVYNQGVQAIFNLLSKYDLVQLDDIRKIASNSGIDMQDVGELISYWTETMAIRPGPNWVSFFQIVDNHGRPTGQLASYFYALKNRLRFQASNGFIVHKGLVYLQISKKNGTLDMSAAGGVTYPNTPLEAMRQETSEELHLELPADAIRPVINPEHPTGGLAVDYSNDTQNPHWEGPVYKTKAVDREGSELDNIYITVLSDEKFNSWIKGKRVTSLEDFKAMTPDERKGLKMNEEVSGIVAATPEEIFQLHEVDKMTTEPMLGQALKASLDQGYIKKKLLRAAKEINEATSTQKVYAITGATGVVGTQLIRYLLKQEDTRAIYVLTRRMDEKDVEKLAGSEGKVHIIQGDLLDVDELKRLVEHSDVIYHLGGWAGQGQTSVQEAELVNGLATEILCRLAQEKNKRIILTSSVAVYQLGKKKEGEIKEKDFDLETGTQPLLRAEFGKLKRMAQNMLDNKRAATSRLGVGLPTDLFKGARLYAFTKLLAERSLSAYPNAIILRLGNVYGPGDETSRVVPRFLKQMTQAGPDQEMTFIPGGQNTYIYVGDVVRALYKAGHAAIIGENRTINVVAPEPVSQENLFLAMKRATNSPVKIVPMSQDEMTRLNLSVPPVVTFSVGLMETQLGIKQKDLTPLNKGMAQTKEWLMDTDEHKKWSVDAATLAHPGGIDLNPAMLNMQVHQSGHGFQYTDLPADVSGIHIDGLVPKIVAVTTIHDLLPVLGLSRYTR